MKLDVLLGLQWGDEGKGKIVDVLTPKYDIIARFQGGPNAGHTLKFNNVKHVLHTIPSGIFHDNALNVIGNGVVIDPLILKNEIMKLESESSNIRQKLVISNRAHLIMPTHKALDMAYEIAKGGNKIGSTQKGIGPTYSDKIARNGLRIGDIHNNFQQKYQALKEAHLRILKNYTYDFDIDEYEKQWFDGIALLKSIQFADTEHLINDSLLKGKSVLAEGAQGTLLDIEFGSYPFVTSSNTITAGACTGLGVAPNKIGEVYGVFKAYCTRVGSGPFPTEQDNEAGKRLQEIGQEVGSTTGRARRCGWLDLVALRYAIMINGVTQLFVTKIDVLNTFESLKVCTAYKVGDKEITASPYSLEGVEPIYREFKGWMSDLSQSTSFGDLPKEAKEYLQFIEKETGVPITVISVGPEREKTFVK